MDVPSSSHKALINMLNEMEEQLKLDFSAAFLFGSWKRKMLIICMLKVSLNEMTYSDCRQC